jgi:ABC-2 type transport system ATP-binding protein
MLLGFVEPTSGQALVDDVDVAVDAIAARRRVAYIPEIVNLHATLDAYENLAYFTALAGLANPSRADADAAFERVGLDPAACGRRVGGYSKGMRQKVGVAIALARGVGNLLLDEPTSGLDPKASNDFSTLMRSLRDDGAAILMATHDLFRAKEDATRIGIMKHGRLVEEIDPRVLGHADLERVYLSHMQD